ncbi:F-box only protein 33-like isoform X2 [Lycorma delicatula]|uniref:F-box only protein 33-like isoform X2 n=1 Tax=Lycorma delicatula TaxID=130591 RepID=UPI003F518103
MAAEEVCWNNLPSVILYEIFSYLSLEDKIRASSSCKHWRYALYHPSFWKNVHLKLKSNDPDNVSKTQYFTSCLGSKLQNLTVTFDSVDPVCVEELANVLQSLIGNFNLRNISLVPSHCSLEYPKRDVSQDFFTRKLLKPILTLAQKSYHLNGLSLGCLEELTANSKNILEEISQYQANSLQTLGLASVKYDPDNYVLFEIDTCLFTSLTNLQILSIDYDYVNDEILSTLSRLGCLQRLVIHVHGIFEGHPGTSNDVWELFTRHNPKCELRLNLIHSYDGVEVLQSKILKPSMPLTHLRAFFCEQLNYDALHYLTFYAKTLKSIWWVDSFCYSSNWILIEPGRREDIFLNMNPFVMCSWICQKLQEIVLLGTVAIIYHTDCTFPP